MPEDKMLSDNVENNITFDTLRAVWGEKLEIRSDAFFTYLKINPEDLLPLMQTLREKYGMNYLSNLTAVDYGEEFEIVYHLYAIPDNGLKLEVKTNVSREKAEIPSVYSIYPTSDWQEREVFDLMGIGFSAHPNMVRVLLPDDFVGYPLRKDFKKEGQ
jgi:NADH-quinone oxidoreductase subunit C